MAPVTLLSAWRSVKGRQLRRAGSGSSVTSVTSAASQGSGASSTGGGIVGTPGSGMVGIRLGRSASRRSITSSGLLTSMGGGVGVGGSGGSVVLRSRPSGRRLRDSKDDDVPDEG